MKKLIGVIVIIVLAVGVIAATRSSKDTGAMQASHSMSNMADSSASSGSTADAVATDKVDITNFKFSPAVITVKKGTKVTWTNKDGVPHTVTADSGTGPNSPNLSGGQTYSYTYNQTGTFAYHCDIHEDMKGTVVVID